MSGGEIATAIATVTQNPQPGEQIVLPYEVLLPPRAEDITGDEADH